MHFVDMRNEIADKKVIEKLKQFAKSEKSKWEEYFSAPKGIKPPIPVAMWNDPAIKQALVEKYQENCGYCGAATDETTTSINRNKTWEAETDHYIPKSEDFDKIYEWSNFVWSCSGCNKHKLAYYKPDCMLLSPMNEQDCDLIEYNDGNDYYLKF